MLFESISLDLEEKSYRKHKGLRVIRPKAFHAYQDRLEKDGKYATVIRNTKLKAVDGKEVRDRLDKGEDILSASDGCHYELKKVRDWPKAGYIAVAEDRFVCCEHGSLIFLLFFLGLSALLALLLMRTPEIPGNAWEPDLDGQASEYTGPQADAPTEQESIVVPGFYRFTATEGGNSLQLHNPDGNTVYFQYDIYLVDDARTAASFPDLDSAQAFVEEHSAEYGCRPEGDGYVLCDADGNAMDSVTLYRAVGNGTGFDVLEEEVSALYQTKLIGPGQQVLWDAYHGLGLGTHQIKLKVSTYDIETGAECYGAIQTVEAEVK